MNAKTTQFTIGRLRKTISEQQGEINRQSAIIEEYQELNSSLKAKLHYAEYQHSRWYDYALALADQMRAILDNSGDSVVCTSTPENPKTTKG